MVDQVSRYTVVSEQPMQRSKDPVKPLSSSNYPQFPHTPHPISAPNLVLCQQSTFTLV